MDQQNSNTLGDALENSAGVNVQTGNGTFDFFVVRGLDSVTASSVLIDGAREPESSYYQMYNVDRVEVLKGPSSFLYGGGPLSGRCIIAASGIYPPWTPFPRAASVKCACRTT